jgi:hypothetical protein
MGVEGIRAAQERFGKGKVMTGEQVRWGLENLNLTQAKLDALGFKGVMRPVSTSCADHVGAGSARIHTWDGTKWAFTSTGSRPTSRSSSRWSRARPPNTRPTRSWQPVRPPIARADLTACHPEARSGIHGVAGHGRPGRRGLRVKPAMTGYRQVLRQRLT